MPRRIVTTTAALAIAVALGLMLAPTVATPALAASDPALFSFTKGFGERPFTGATITVRGKADPASGSILTATTAVQQTSTRQLVPSVVNSRPARQQPPSP